MDLDPTVRLEWSTLHALTTASLRWIEEHADAGDPHPITTAIGLLRAASVYPRTSPLPAE